MLLELSIALLIEALLLRAYFAAVHPYPGVCP
jgi:hypothetical protein